MKNQNYKSNTHTKSMSILLLCVLTLSLTPFLGAASAQQTGKIDVSVQGYDGNSTITASLLDANSHYLENKTVTTDSFSFTGVSLDQPHSIVLTYKGIPYITPVNATQDSQQQVNVTVYELATSDEGIMIYFHHVAISQGDNGMHVSEVIEFLNVGDTVQNGTDLKVSMPDGFTNFQSTYSYYLTKADFGYFFKLTSPLFPGGVQDLDLQYDINPDTDQYQFVKREYYDTGFAVVTLLAGGDLQVVPNSNETINSEGPVDIQNQTYDAYSAQYVYAGEGFALTLTGYRSATGINFIWVGTGVLFALIAGAVIYGFRGNKVSDEKLESEAEALNSVMAELEKDFKEEKITEVDYLKLKLKYKSRLDKIQGRLDEMSKVETTVKPKPKSRPKPKTKTDSAATEEAGDTVEEEAEEKDE